MNQNQIIGEIKYRFASLLLDHLLEDKVITKVEWIIFKKKLIKKYNPIIKYINHEITNTEATAIIGVSRGTFFRLVKERKCNH